MSSFTSRRLDSRYKIACGRILGAGGISDTHSRAARAIDGVQVVAVHARITKRRGLWRRPPAPPPSTTSTRFLAAPWTSSPSAVRRRARDQAIRGGAPRLHSWSRSRSTSRTAKIDALIAEADRARVKIGVFFQERLTPELVALKASLDAGTLGDPVFISGHVKWYRPPEYYGASRWRGTWKLDGGGALMNQGIHTVDLLLLFGPVRSVMVRTANRLHRVEVEDTAARCSNSRTARSARSRRRRRRSRGFPRRLRCRARKAPWCTKSPHGRRRFADATAAPPRESRISSPRSGTDGAEVWTRGEGRRQRRRRRSDLSSARSERLDTHEPRQWRMPNAECRLEIAAALRAYRVRLHARGAGPTGRRRDADARPGGLSSRARRRRARDEPGTHKGGWQTVGLFVFRNVPT